MNIERASIAYIILEVCRLTLIHLQHGFDNWKLADPQEKEIIPLRDCPGGEDELMD